MARLRSCLVLVCLGPGLLASSGCMVFGMGSYNLLSESKRVMEDCIEQKRNQRLAEAAWQQVVMECGDIFGPDYACGFKFGFCEYLYRGACEPPAMPPIKLRSLKYQSAEGCEAVAQWRAGFRHGVNMARDTGYRNYVTCWLEAGAAGPPPPPPGDPAGLPPGPPLPTPAGPVLPPYPATPGPAGPVTPGEMLPAPRQVPQPGKEEPTPPPGKPEASVPRMPQQLKAESLPPVEVHEEYEQTFVTIPGSGPK